MRTYTEKQKEEFVALAQKTGIGRAIKELGYPSWPTGKDWCDARGVTPAVDTLMQEVKKFHTFYETTDALLIAEEGMGVVHEKLLASNLDEDGLKKVSEAFQKFSNQWLVLQGRAASITESQSKDSTHVELMSLLNKEIAEKAGETKEPVA